MSRLLLSLLAILAIFSVTAVSARERCPRNEVWDTCGTACPLTCKEPHQRPCTLQCIIGCRCADGLVRNNSGKCVRPEKC